MTKLKVLELFAGNRSIGKAFEDAGHEVYSVEWDEKHKDIDHYGDVYSLTKEQILKEFGQPDIIWASPDCTTYSLAGIRYHRRNDPITGKSYPISDYAKFCDESNPKLIQLIKDINPKYYFIENPRAVMRKMPFMKDLPRYTVTYCQYGASNMKPTDIWTNHPEPNFIPTCKNGAPCHVASPRGSSTGLQGTKKSERSLIPKDLCRHIVKISEV